MAKSAGIIVIGNEILSGKTRDENAAYLVRELRDLGVDVRKVSVIPDEIEPIRDEVRTFSGAFNYVFTTGGVGPTPDDMTMEGIAAAFNRKMYRHAELESILRQYYNEDITDAGLRMADIPEGTYLVRAGGMWFPVVTIENVYVFPGVPEIVKHKFERIKEMFREAPFLLREVYLRVDESRIAGALHRVMAEFPNILLGSYPAFNDADYLVKITIESKDASYLEKAHLFLLAQIEESFIVPIPSGK